MDEAAKVSADERLVVYCDLMRVSGLWAYTMRRSTSLIITNKGVIALRAHQANKTTTAD